MAAYPSPRMLRGRVARRRAAAVARSRLSAAGAEPARRSNTDRRLGAFPSTLDALLGLPGVGSYTARAVLAFAFEADVAVVDTNIARVLARVAGRRLTAEGSASRSRRGATRGESWAWNQCLMDLGAVLCRPTAPQCEACPWRGRCAWRGSGDDPAVGSAGVSKTPGAIRRQ